MQAQETSYYLRVVFQEDLDIFKYHPPPDEEPRGIAASRYPLATFLLFATYESGEKDLNWPIQGIGKTPNGIRLYSGDSDGLSEIAPHLEACLRVITTQNDLTITPTVFKAEVDEHERNQESDESDDFPAPMRRSPQRSAYYDTQSTMIGTVSTSRSNTSSTSQSAIARNLENEFNITEDNDIGANENDISFAHQDSQSHCSQPGANDAPALPSTPPPTAKGVPNQVTGGVSTRAHSRSTSTPPVAMLDKIDRLGKMDRTTGTLFTTVEEEGPIGGGQASQEDDDIKVKPIKEVDIRHYYEVADPSAAKKKTTTHE